MKKKRFIILFIAIGIALVATYLVVFDKIKNIGTYDDYQVIEHLNEIRAYTSEVSINVINDKETNVYDGNQKYIRSKGYKLDLNDGRSYIFKGDDIQVKDEQSQRQYTLDKDFDEVFRYGFIGEYLKLIYTNEELNFGKETIENRDYFIITTLIPGSNNNLYEGSMYYDLTTCVPSKIIIYDNNHKERVIYNYSNFNWTDKESDMNMDF